MDKAREGKDQGGKVRSAGQDYRNFPRSGT